MTIKLEMVTMSCENSLCKGQSKQEDATAGGGRSLSISLPHRLSLCATCGDVDDAIRVDTSCEKSFFLTGRRLGPE